jgi:hypothetical protein
LSARAFTFAEFRLLPEERTLLEAGKPVRISSRALDILTVLVEHAGELVTPSPSSRRSGLLKWTCWGSRWEGSSPKRSRWDILILRVALSWLAARHRAAKAFRDSAGRQRS